MPIKIDGVLFGRLTTYFDKRGFFREIIRFSSVDKTFESGQLSHSRSLIGTKKAWHGHLIQGQINYLAVGAIRVSIYDSRASSATYGDCSTLVISEDVPFFYYLPPGVLHGYEVLSPEAHMFYVTTGVYTPTEEVRLECIPVDHYLNGCESNS
jgi:dTDP-4-dehydrorhamnose 3,5-epimerase